MNRETKEIITPIGKNKIVVKSWLTGGESEQIQGVFLSGQDINASNQTDFKLKGSIIAEANHKAIETIVVSIDEKTDNILKTILDLRAEDYRFIVDEVNKLTNPSITAEKKS